MIESDDRSLQQWLDYQLRLHPRAVDLGLERVRRVGERLGVLAPRATVITVAGTNGKGSSVAMLEAILAGAGYQVGTYTSPHLIRYNERIRINGTPVSDEQLVAAFNAIDRAREDTLLTFFEFGTLAALWLFGQQFLDAIILEVGLGGRLDATNAVDADIALITAIDVDHADWLGDDREAIGREKAGILRSGRPAVVSDPNPPRSVLEVAEAQAVPLALAGRDFHWRRHGVLWDYEGGVRLNGLPEPALPGDYQLQNAAGVLAVLERLPVQFYLTRTHIERGLRQVRHPGRLQHLQVAGQSWLVDVAHNPQGARALADYLAGRPERGWQCVFSALNDKDVRPMVEAVAPHVAHWHVAPLEDARAMPLDALKEALRAAGVDESAVTPHEHLDAAVAAARQAQAPVLAWGSLVTVGGVLERLGHG